MTDEPDEKLLWCKVTVDCEGMAVARYRWEGADRDGADRLDDDVTLWSDNDLCDVAASIVGIEGDDVDKIEVVRE